MSSDSLAAGPDGAGNEAQTPALAAAVPSLNGLTLGSPESGHHLARHGFGLSEEEIAAAADPDSDISKEIAAARAAGGAEAARVSDSSQPQSTTSAVDDPASVAQGAQPASAAALAREREADYVAAALRLGMHGERAVVWSGGSLGIRRMALQALLDLGALDDDWDRRQTQKALGAYVQTHPSDSLNREIVATANAIVTIGREERDAQLRRRFNRSRSRALPILWPFLATSAAFLAIGLVGAVAGAFVGVGAGIVTWWLVMVVLMRDLEGK